MKALKGSHRTLICIGDTGLIDGSVYIDSCTESRHHGENRWDYAIGHDSKVYYVEVHPAFSGEIEAMRKKKEWLIDWLKKNNELDSYPAGTPKHQWIATNGIHIEKTSSHLRKLAQLGIKPARQATIR